MFPGVEVYLTPYDYVQAFATTCYVHIYSIETSPAEVLLGDTLFMQYNITFDKESEQIGFDGDIGQVDGFGSRTFVILQYCVFLGEGIVLFFGLIICWMTICSKDGRR